MRRDVAGGWAELRAAEDLTERQARPIRRARALLEQSILQGAAGGFNVEDPATWASIPVEAYGDAADALNDVLISTYVVAWSFDGQPSEAADVLPRKTFDELAGVIDEIDRADLIDPAGASDPKAPTDAENASEQPSRDEPPTP